MTINSSITFKHDKKNKEKIVRAIITGAHLYYVKLQKPSAIFEQRDVRNPTKTEWTADLVVSEDTADEYDAVFTKQSSKKVTKADFMKRYKIEDEKDLPDPKAKKFFVIKVKHSAQDRDGNDIGPDSKLRPRAVEMVDGKPVDITYDKLVGNGSTGDVLLRVAQNDFGTFSYLNMIKLTNLIEYELSGGDADEKEFLGAALERDIKGHEDSEQSADEEEEGAEEPPFEVEDDDEY